MPNAVIERLEKDETQRNEFWCLPTPSCELIRLLIKSSGAKNICEIGTSIGYSTLWMASAFEQDGHHDGHIDTIEATAERQDIAKANLAEAGLAKHVTFHCGDAIDLLNEFQATHKHFDFVFIDACKQEYLDYWRVLKPMLGAGAILVADNTQSHRESMLDFIEAITSDNDFDTCDLNTPNGLVIARKKLPPLL